MSRRFTAVLVMTLAACSNSATPTPSPTTGSALPSPSPAGEPSPAPASPGLATPSAVPAAWVGAGAFSTREECCGRIAVHAVPIGVDRVLAVGSDNVCTPGEAWDSSVAADLADWRAGTWQQAPSLPRPRDRFVLVRLPDGSALVAGGTTDLSDEGGPQSFSSSFRLAPGGSSWIRSGDLNVARSRPAGAVLADGRVLIAGGYYVNEPVEGPRTLASAELYDPATGTWARTGSLGTPRFSASAVTLTDGRVLVVGGFGTVGEFGGHDDALASAEAFDPVTGTWSAAGSLPVSAVDAPLVALADGGALLVAEGAAYRFDPAPSSWRPTAPMVSDAADGRTVVALADGRVLVAGGYVMPDERERYIAEAEIYDPAIDRWDETAQMPARRSYAVGVLLTDGSVLVAGGASVEPTYEGAPNCPIGADDAVRYLPGG